MPIKETFKLSTLFFSATLLSQVASADTFFYKHTNFSQPLFSMGPNEKVPTMPSGANDEISSFHTTDCLLVFKNANFAAGQNYHDWRLYQSSANLNSNQEFANDSISSAITFSKTGLTCVHGVLYQHNVRQFRSEGGSTFPIIPDHFIRRLKLINLNDRISSVFIPQGYCLKAWQHSPSESIESDPIAFQNFLNNPDVTFYGYSLTGPNLNPDTQVFTGGQHTDVPNKWNDELSSVLMYRCW